MDTSPMSTPRAELLDALFLGKTKNGRENRGNRSVCARTSHVRGHTQSQGPFWLKRPFAAFRDRGASSSKQPVTFTASPARSPLPLRLPKSPWASSTHG